MILVVDFWQKHLSKAGELRLISNFEDLHAKRRLACSRDTALQTRADSTLARLSWNEISPENETPSHVTSRGDLFT